MGAAANGLLAGRSGLPTGRMEVVNRPRDEAGSGDGEAGREPQPRSDQLRGRLRARTRPASLPPVDDAGAEPDASEQSELAAAALAGDEGAKEQLIERFLPLVARIARSYQVEGLEFTDLVQEGVLGLLRALQRYEPQRGTPFAAFATWWIRQSLQELRSDFMRPQRLPPRAVRQLARLKSEHSRFYGAERREPTLDELAERTGIGREQVDALVRADAGARLFSEPVDGVEGEVGVLGDLIEDPLSADAFEEVLDSIAGEQIRGLLAQLSDREREVIEARFGFGERETERLAEIGERHGLSAERVRQIEERALTKLRAAS
jgi:RNA polymerase sigma factor (sigma-70 family)